MAGPLRAGILGATGAVGQKLVRLLSGHPWFRVNALSASERSAGRSYGEAVRWLEPDAMPGWASEMEVRPPSPDLPCDVVFSALEARVATRVEPLLAATGFPVISNARSLRLEPGVPLLVPEVNPHHLGLLGKVGPGDGFVVTNPNCSTTGLVLALKPLHDAFRLDRVSVTTLQAISGGGYPGIPALDILGNVVPDIPGEEEKLESEPLKLLGEMDGTRIRPPSLAISAQCNRVPVLDGHLLSVSVGFQRPVGVEEAREAMKTFKSPLGGMGLPSAIGPPLVLSDDPAFPQPRLHSGAGGGFAVGVGQFKRCQVLDLRFVALVHNTIRGAAGGAILNAELLRARGLLQRRE